MTGELHQSSSDASSEQYGAELRRIFKEGRRDWETVPADKATLGMLALNPNLTVELTADQSADLKQRLDAAR